MFLTVLISVLSFTTYNVAIHAGKMSNAVFLLALREVPVEFAIAFLLEALVAGRTAEKLAFRIVDPASDRPIVVVLAITAMTICIMCPAMSLAATILYDGLDAEFLAHWLEKVRYNFPFAFFTQIFFIGPFVRFAFRGLFRRGAKAAA
jgi:hypothetical protein